jgi:phage-related protein
LKILSIKRGKFQVGAVVREKGDGALSCPLIDDFDEIEATYEASRNRLLAYFSQVAAGGLQALNDAQCHTVDAKQKISEFIAGQLRVLCFQGAKGHMVICSHMFLKKSQKTPVREIEKAVRAKQAYEKAEAAGLVQWKDEL